MVVIGGRPRCVAASWSQLSHCPVKYTVDGAEGAEQSTAVMTFLGARPEGVAQISWEGRTLIGSPLITVFLLDKKIDQWVLINVRSLCLEAVICTEYNLSDVKL